MHWCLKKILVGAKKYPSRCYPTIKTVVSTAYAGQDRTYVCFYLSVTVVF